ncbi:unnamed protein product [Vicia faba]|uniref:FAR1 domain-containing protein n=1 Tax=Vicia faba TaxID=3906 RepID=A0AAV1A3E9_VICFA|nr:unnamed protein product [Vicia faba]
MDDYAGSVGVDLNNVHNSDSSDAECSYDEDVNYVGSSGHQSSNDEDEYDNDDGEESVGAEVTNSDAVVGDRVASVTLITFAEIRALEFGTVSEAYEFYHNYGKCKGFSIRKNDVRQRGPGSEIVVIR